MTKLSEPDRSALLGIARAAILAHLGQGRTPELPHEGPLGEPRAAFVTLYLDGELRGCVGTLEAVSPLARTVERMAVAAASEDPRFPALGRRRSRGCPWRSRPSPPSPP